MSKFFFWICHTCWHWTWHFWFQNPKQELWYQNMKFWGDGMQCQLQWMTRVKIRLSETFLFFARPKLFESGKRNAWVWKDHLSRLRSQLLCMTPGADTGLKKRGLQIRIDKGGPLGSRGNLPCKICKIEEMGFLAFWGKVCVLLCLIFYNLGVQANPNPILPPRCTLLFDVVPSSSQNTDSSSTKV